MNLNELRDTSYEIAKSKGWHDADMKRSFADLMALVISELAEALEEHRKDKPARNIEYVKDGVVVCTYAPTARSALDTDETLAISKTTALRLVEAGHKPEGVIIELADALIRIGDCAGEYRWDLESVQGRPTSVAELVQPDGDRRATFGEWFCEISLGLCEVSLERLDAEIGLIDAADSIGALAHWLGITGEELERAIKIKHAYNRTRPHRHGGKIL